MAAKQLNELWDAQVGILNQSYAKTTDLLNAGKDKEAADEFHGSFVPAVKKIFSEAPETYPEKFAGVGDWCGWIKGVYITTMKADKALAAGKTDQAKTLILSLHESFFKLHETTKTLQAGDIVFALESEVQKAQPDTGRIKDLSGKLLQAKLSPKAAVSADAFNKARSDYSAKVKPMVADQKVDSAELPALRSATDTLYKTYGNQLE